MATNQLAPSPQEAHDQQADLEATILHSLVFTPELIRSIDLNPEWFVSIQHQLLATYLINAHGEQSYMHIRDGIEDDSPGTITQATWNAILENEPLPNMFSYQVHSLDHAYRKRKVLRSAQAYSKTPSNSNLEAVATATQALQSFEQETTVTLTMADLEAQLLDKMASNTAAPGIKAFPYLDIALNGGLMPGMLLTIGARPAVGKSAWALNLAAQVISKQPEARLDYFSLEMTATELYKRLVTMTVATNSIISGRVHSNINGGSLNAPGNSLNADQQKMVHKATSYISAMDMQFHTGDLSLNKIVQVIRQRKAEASHEYVAIIDYLGLVNVYPRHKDHRLDIEEITRQLKLLAIELEIPIVLLTQLNRGIESRQDKKPILSDLRESGAIEQDSNVVAFLYNDTASDTKADLRNVVLSISKNREGKLADLGYTFDTRHMYFAEVR
ncbi:Replicative DNA helicase [Lacticaseibacillus pantheris DSM 15945 = JCM 12539 = NBRC 106106]|uniref:Replicative DNA helicase n=2 Tax=Lacticaseibacillus pantheris TaxID=171523 RepID=A0A0R1U0W3_9LACO|nr:DnaB-like helicase C-terminal domain-containing protein [Lacticaseibacillus pantheris]KRL87055.1 Replicative DNA helicase [Lacticaseibacillus pantheris DSM 15945 = JCM 12539 = NBRC 106106]